MNISNHLRLQAQSFQQVVQHLSGTSQTWLLVLDNADDPNTDLQPYFPPGSRGTVVVTSRNPECGRTYGRDHWEQLDVLGHSKATDLLLQAAGHSSTSPDRKHAHQIVLALGCHTLAVILAGFYVARHGNLDKYLDVYEKHWHRIVTHTPRQDRSRYGSVLATFEASMAILEGEGNETSHDAIELLQVLSAMGANDVPLSIFEKAWSGISRVSQTDEADSLDNISNWHVSRLPGFIGSSIGEWDSYRLVEACSIVETLAILISSGSGVGCKLSMHPLLHDWIWRRQNPQQMERSWTMAGSAISLAFYRSEAWSEHENEYRSQLRSHITTWQKYKLFPSPGLPILQIVYCCAVVLDKVRSDPSALLCLDEIARTGSRHLKLPMNFNKLWARCRQRNGDTEGSITLWKQVGELECDLAENHPDRLASQHELASTYLAYGQAKQAINILEHVVKVWEDSLEDEHPDLLASQHELASAYQANGQMEQAITLLKHVVDIRGSLAEDHLDRLISQHALARAYRVHGQAKLAITLLEKIVTIEEYRLAEDHPDRLTSQHELASAYQANDQVMQAIALLEHVVNIRGSLAEDHPDRLTSQHALASAYQDNGQVEQAIPLLEHVVKVWGVSLAEDHPRRLASQHALACSYQANGQGNQAIALLEHIVEVEGHSLAEDHPDRLISQHELAIMYQGNGRVKEAVILLEHVVKVEGYSLAEDHPDRLASQWALVEVYMEDGQTESALQMQRLLSHH